MEPALPDLAQILRAHAWYLTQKAHPSRLEHLEEHPKPAGAAQILVGGQAPARSPQGGGRVECSLGELEQILRARICRVCSDRREDGSCGLEKPADCAIFRYLPELARAIQATESADVKDYVRSIRSQVCSICPQQAADGSCELRQEVRCALDAYLILIVDAIEEAIGKQPVSSARVA